MKRIVALSLILVMALSLFGCGKSKAAGAFDDLVKAIGTVSLESEAAIVEAENAYNALTDEEKESVAKSNTSLAEMRAEYERLVEQDAKIKAVVALVDAIGEVTVDSNEAISAAEAAYEALSEEEKGMVADVAQKLAEYREKYDTEMVAARVEEVTNAIDAIGTVSVAGKEKVTTARELYDALSDAEKKLVTNFSALEDAEAELEKLWEAEKQKIVDTYSKKFGIDKDPVEGISWYMHDNMPNYIDTRCYIIPYIGVKGNNKWICIRYNYTADSWIFWETLTIMVDGEKYFKNVGYYNTVRDNDTEVWEYYDECLNYNQAMDSSEIKMLKAIAESDETIIRFQGDDYYHDLYVSQKDKQMIKDTLTLYEAMIG
ncbi:MAG: hypothetical protein IKJ88_06880 [Clostridia bacterium]|nr:hypothetical protein [Clostridia bacterium]